MSISINPAAREAVNTLFNMITIEDIVDYLARNAPTFKIAEVTYGFEIKKKDDYRYIITDKFEPTAETHVIGFKPLNAGPKRFMKSSIRIANIAQSGIIIIISSDEMMVWIRETVGDCFYCGPSGRKLPEEHTKSLKEKLKNLLK